MHARTAALGIRHFHSRDRQSLTVEVLGGKLTSPETVERTLAFYAKINKKPIRIRQEVKGHIANRLQAALWQEAFSLVERGVATVADIDTAISHGPGLRWALLGPFLNLEIAGGSGGLGHVLEHLGPPTESWWADLKPVHLNADLNQKAVDYRICKSRWHDEVEPVDSRHRRILLQSPPRLS